MNCPAELAQAYAEEKVHPDDWDIRGLKDAVFKQFSFPLQLPPSVNDLTSEGLKDVIAEQARTLFTTPRRPNLVKRCCVRLKK